MSKKQEIARWRNMTKGRIVLMSNMITNILTSLPEGKVISQSEVNELIQIRKELTAVASRWNDCTEIVLNRLN